MPMVHRRRGSAETPFGKPATGERQAKFFAKEIQLVGTTQGS
jgi:hypothetical protein